MQKYYYTDKEELDALRVENAKLKQEIEELKQKLAKKGGSKNGTSKKED